MNRRVLEIEYEDTWWEDNQFEVKGKYNNEAFLAYVLIEPKRIAVMVEGLEKERPGLAEELTECYRLKQLMMYGVSD